MKNNYAMIHQLLKERPDMAFGFGRAFLRLNKAKLLDYNFYNGRSHEMPLMTFKITPLCNLRCVMCGQRGVTGTLKGKFAVEESKKLVPIERYKELVDEVKKKTKVFYVWGGEPFMYPDFMDLAGYMAKNIEYFTVNTNGTYLEENAERIVRDKWEGIFISLDAFEDVNDEIRGKGSYRKVMNGIMEINKQKKLQKSTVPYMGIVTTVSNMNYLHLHELAADMANKGLSWHIINLGTYMTQEIGNSHYNYVKKHLDVEWTHWQGFASGYNEGIDGEKFADILKKVHSYQNGYPIITVPVIRPHKINKYYSELEVPVRDRCAAPWFSTNINYDGSVGFCADYPDYIIGNIMENKLWDLYNNEKAVKFRKLLKSSPDGLLPACKRCYQIMLCGRRKKGF